MEIFAQVTSFPPLGQLTVLEQDQQEVEFTVCIETARAFTEVEWEVSLWHNLSDQSDHEDSPEWRALPLSCTADEPFDLASAVNSRIHCYFFSGTLSLGSCGSGAVQRKFTVKYRAGQDSPWKWVNNQFGTLDGSLLRPKSQVINESSSHWASSTFGDRYLAGWDITSIPSQVPESSLYRVTSKTPIPRKSMNDAQFETLTFGSSNVGFYRYMALVRVWSPWLAPRHGEHSFNLTEDALLCSFLTKGGQSLVLLPVNGLNDTVTLFRSDPDGHIVVAARNDGTTEQKFEFLAATADSFEKASCAVVYEARKVIMANQQLNPSLKSDLMTSTAVEISDNSSQDDEYPGPRPPWLESWIDGMTFCTWNSLGQDLTIEKILDALDDLASNGIKVSGLIIDDNWQSLDGTQGETSQFDRGWTDFEANPSGFPGGLKSAVTRIKQHHPSIANIAVWHALCGYWGSVSPSGKIAKSYKTVEVQKQIGQGKDKFLLVDPSDIHRLYDDFYSFLSSCGVTSVKTDVQFYLDLLSSTPDRRAFTNAYQSAWTIAHLRHFAGKAISCMSHIPQILFHSLLPHNKPRILLRTSDDFFPTVPASHPWHIFCNAHNVLFFQHLNVLPDWDMFQTSHPYSYYHAAARCVSGGAIYITDTPGQHDVKLVAMMTAEDIRGNTIILRPSVVGRTVGIYDQYHEGRILKVGAYNGRAQTGNGILGVFNITDHPITALFPLTDIPGIEAPTRNRIEENKYLSKSYLVHSHVTNRTSAPIIPDSPPSPGSLIYITLPVRGYDVLSSHPIYNLPTINNSTSTSIAPLGLLSKFTGVCALLGLRIQPGPKTHRVHITLRALGTLGLWISDLGARDLERDFLVTIGGMVVPRERVRLGESGTRESEEQGDGWENLGKGDGEVGPEVLEIDILGAWKDLELEPGWGSEVTVTVLMRRELGDLESDSLDLEAMV